MYYNRLCTYLLFKNKLHFLTGICRLMKTFTLVHGHTIAIQAILCWLWLDLEA